MGGQASFTPTKISNILLNFLALIVRIKILIFQSNLSTVLVYKYIIDYKQSRHASHEIY